MPRKGRIRPSGVSDTLVERGRVQLYPGKISHFNMEGGGSVSNSAYDSYQRRGGSPMRNRSRSPIRSRSPRRSRSPQRARYHSRSRSPVRRRYSSRSRSPPRRYMPRDSRDSRDYRSNDRYDRYESRRFDRRPPQPRERRPVYRGTEEERAASKTLFIGNLPFFYEERDVSHLMERFGPLRKITIPQERFARKNRGFCFVEFEERRDAEDAMQKYQGYSVEGRELRIDWDVGSERKFAPREEGRQERSDRTDRNDRPDRADSYRSREAPRSVSRSPIRAEDY